MIRRIEALNYRSLRYVSQEVRPFQVLVGANASGKSTFLDVVALLGDFVHNGLGNAILFGAELEKGRASRLDELVFNQSTDHFELALELAVPEHLRQIDQGEDKWQPDTVRYEVTFGKDKNNGELEIRAETLWLLDNQHSPKKNQSEPSHLFPLEPQPPSTLMTQTDKPPPGWQIVVQKMRQSGKDYFQAETSNWNITFRVGQHKAALSGVPEDTERFPIAIWVRDLLRSSISRLTLNSVAMRRPVSPSASRHFSVEGANLPIVIQDLKRYHWQSYQDWIAHIQTILPELTNIEIYERSEDRHLYLALRYANTSEPVPAWLISDGTLRLLALTLLAYLPEQSGIYLIEEPENGIHPKALEGMFQSLSSVYCNDVLVATHSPLLLGLSEPSQLLCFAKNPSGAVDIISGEQHPALKNWRGEIEISTLYAAGVLG